MASGEPRDGVKAFAHFVLIVSALPSLALIQSATRAQTSVSNSYLSEETTIQPQSIVSGYPVVPTHSTG